MGDTAQQITQYEVYKPLTVLKEIKLRLKKTNEKTTKNKLRFKAGNETIWKLQSPILSL